MYGFNKSKIYEVEEILDEAVIDNEPHYLIKWEKLGHQYDTWQPISSLANISDYLKFWLKERQKKLNKAKEKQNNVNYTSIKHFIDRENMQPKRKTIRQQYADEVQLERKKQRRQKFGAKLLKRKKIWEKYLEYDARCIDLVEDDEEEIQNIQKSFQSNEVNITNRLANKQPRQQEMEIEQPHSKDQSNKLQEQKSVQYGLKRQQSQKLKVIRTIDTSQIAKICRIFDWSEILCAEIEMSSGEHYNMKYQELKVYQPQLVRQFQMKMGN